MFRFFVLLCSAIICSIVSARPYIINISSQAAFDDLDKRIEIAYKDGNNEILVKLRPNVYMYDESHLKLKYADSTLNLSFNGRGSILRGKCKKSAYQNLHSDLVYFTEGELVDGWSHVFQMPNLVEIMDKDKKICRLQKGIDITVSEGDFIQVSQSYLANRYQVINVSNDYIYFIASDLEFIEAYNGWNINKDYLKGKELPRYRAFSVSIPHDEVTDVKNFLALDNARIGKLSIENLVFEGCAYANWITLIHLNKVDSRHVSFSNCKFTGCHSACINIKKTNNVLVENCWFENNYAACIKSDQHTQKLIVRNNHFSNNGQGWTNQFNVRCESEDFIISKNIFKDFGYGAIGIGVWYASEKSKDCKVRGVVENNEIFYTSSYFADYKHHTLMDGGAIYTFTKNDDVTIRYNYIHDFIGMLDNRGIFCDDGTCNVNIYGNIITNTPNCYSIDLREVASVEADPRYDFGKANVGNQIYGNIVDGSIRFEGRKDDPDNGCKKGSNYLLATGENLPVSRISSVQVIGEDMAINCLSTDSKVTLDKESFKLFKKHPYYKQLRRWIKRGKT